MTISLPQVKKVAGLILYKGPSLINNKPIVVIATGLLNKSDNIKTGNMVQVWILHARKNPLKAYYSGSDDAICGDCKHGKMGTCYVNIAQGPYSVFKAYKRGFYTVATPELIAEHLNGRKVRFGAYGDPSAVPVSVFQPIIEIASGWTAYTHQWAKPFAQDCKPYCMASVDTPREYEKARSMGWRTFRVRLENEPLQSHEFVCPASHEGGKRLNCDTCMACNGNPTASLTKGTVSIIIHGTNYKAIRFNAVRERQVAKKGWQDLIPDKVRLRALSCT